MIATLLAKLEVNEEEFISVCIKANEDKKNEKNIRTVLSGTDFKLFKEVMNEENKRLNDEAYEVLKSQQAKKKKDLKSREQEELDAAIKESIEFEVEY